MLSKVTLKSAADVPKFVAVITKFPLNIGLLLENDSAETYNLRLGSYVNKLDDENVFPLNVNTIVPSVPYGGVLKTIYLFEMDVGVTVTPLIVNVNPT